MKNISAREMVDDATSEIQKLAPKNSHVAIEVREDPIGFFSTHIRLQTKYKTYFVKKDDAFLYRSFSRAMRAIKMQMQKRRINHLHQHTSLKHT